MSNSNVTLDDLLAGQSSVLARIAKDLEDMDGLHPTAGHNSSTTGHNSTGTHTSHTSGVSSAPALRAPSATSSDPDRADTDES